MRVEIAQGIEAFQAYDEGSIPFTRSSFFDPLQEARFIAPARLLD